MKPSRTFRVTSSVALALSLAVALPARGAQRGAGTVYDRNTFPYGERVNQPLTLPASFLRIDVPVVVNISREHVGEPVSVPLAIDYGVTKDVQLGIFHARGLCLSGASHGCPEAYDDFGGRAMIGLSRTPEAQLALEVDLLARRFGDAAYQATVALWYKRSIGNVGVTFDAGLASRLNKRGNAQFTDLVFGDAEGAVQLGESLSLFSRIGVNRELFTASGYDARFRVPVAFGVEFEPIRKFDVGLELGFPNLLGEDATSDERDLVILLRLYV